MAYDWFRSAAESGPACPCVGPCVGQIRIPVLYTVVRAGTGWPEVGGVATESRSAAAGAADTHTSPGGRGRVPTASVGFPHSDQRQALRGNKGPFPLRAERR